MEINSKLKLYKFLFYYHLFNASCQFKLLNLLSLIFGIAPLGWLHTCALQKGYEFHGGEYTWMAAHCILRHSPCCPCSSVKVPCCVCLRLSHYLSHVKKATITQTIIEQKKNIRPTNNRSSNLNDNNWGEGG